MSHVIRQIAEAETVTAVEGRMRGAAICRACIAAEMPGTPLLTAHSGHFVDRLLARVGPGRFRTTRAGARHEGICLHAGLLCGSGNRDGLPDFPPLSFRPITIIGPRHSLLWSGADEMHSSQLKIGRPPWAEACRCAATIGLQDSSTSTGVLLCPLYVDSSRPVSAKERHSPRARERPKST